MPDPVIADWWPHPPTPKCPDCGHAVSAHWLPDNGPRKCGCWVRETRSFCGCTRKQAEIEAVPRGA